MLKISIVFFSHATKSLMLGTCTAHLNPSWEFCEQPQTDAEPFGLQLQE